LPLGIRQGDDADGPMLLIDSPPPHPTRPKAGRAGDGHAADVFSLADQQPAVVVDAFTDRRWTSIARGFSPEDSHKRPARTPNGRNQGTAEVPADRSGLMLRDEARAGRRGTTSKICFGLDESEQSRVTSAWLLDRQAGQQRRAARPSLLRNETAHLGNAAAGAGDAPAIVPNSTVCDGDRDALASSISVGGRLGSSRSKRR
jgi:hypothetical protein